MMAGRRVDLEKLNQPLFDDLDLVAVSAAAFKINWFNNMYLLKSVGL